MGARTKLNSAYLVGILLVSALVGAVFQSWLAFFIFAGVTVALAFHAGEVRLSPVPATHRMPEPAQRFRPRRSQR